ncbi:TIGR02302 family protein [Chelativorans sp. ZYF759]|uniref:TIGR02302 family protein n=1 Tax=Chelativorans sp. ZYF759 TaxID=2692213 RepID=UPI00145E9F4F|nr:TIGR02302 family protein [Chelativorans sp. ZYF759]NMG38270.1 TIGR02302 family protein [Chelativorans sp. ZYF759]
MASDPDAPEQTGLLARLARARLAAAGVMWTERVWPLLVPVLFVLALFVSLSWLGVFRLVPEWARMGLGLVFGLALIAALLPFRKLRPPEPAEIDRRIERANRLDHAPVLTQTDRLSGASDDAFAAALWGEHRRRMAQKLDRLAGDLPHPRVPERDPWAIRAIAPLLLVVAFAFSFGPLGGSLTDAFRAKAGAEPVPPRIDAWVTPPPYTGRAPVYLTSNANRGEDIFTVPAGSQLAVRVTGGSGAEAIDYLDAHTGEVNRVDPSAAQPSSSQFDMALSADGLLTLHEDETEIRSWRFLVTPDDAPVIRLAEEPRRARNGSLELTYEIEDDYGAVAAEASFEHADASDSARPLYDAPEMALSLPRRDADAARTVRDLTDHAWAGAVVDLTLVARDAAEQEGRSEPTRFVLPERPFTNPLAMALVEQRRLLALDANQQRHVLDLMDAITLRPEEAIDNLSHYLGVMSARSRLAQARTDDSLREVADYLWEIAVRIEDGSLSDAERRLQAAQEALRDALENGASDEELQELMAELREAMQEFLRELAQRGQQNPDQAMQMPQDGQMLTQRDLDRMLDQLEDLARSGARDQAQDLLSQLQDMMNNLQAGRQQNQQGGQQSEMNQQLNELGEMLRRQQELMNETHQMEQMRPGPRGDEMSPEEFADAMEQLQEQQGQLGQDLQSLMEALEGMGLEPGDQFGDAGDAMGRAGDALGEQQGQRAVGEQGQALEALRRGAQDMMQQMQQAMQGEEGGSEEGGQRQQGADRDPLGRPRANTGPDFGDSVRVPDEIDAQRARRILEAIRDRLGNTLSPDLERNYLERLLEMR